jgi:8-oxo-dGTP pyrophosphatase MutT (NUDIX family)
MSIPRIGVILIYKKNTTNSSEDEYLTVYQDASKLWGFPKGRWKNCEIYTEGACRELFEETGIKITPDELSYKKMFHIKRGKHHHYYFVKHVDEKPLVFVDGYEVTDYKWCSLEEISSKKVSYFTEQLIKKLYQDEFTMKSEVILKPVFSNYKDLVSVL